MHRLANYKCTGWQGTFLQWCLLNKVDAWAVLSDGIANQHRGDVLCELFMVLFH